MEITVEIDMEALASHFSETYSSLYDSCDRVPGYAVAVEDGQHLLETRPEVVMAFVAAREDVLSSDRELAAFSIALRTTVAESL